MCVLRGWVLAGCSPTVFEPWSSAVQESRVGWVEPGVELRCTLHTKLSRVRPGLSADLEPWDWNPGGRKGEAGSTCRCRG